MEKRLQHVKFQTRPLPGLSGITQDESSESLFCSEFTISGMSQLPAKILRAMVVTMALSSDTIIPSFIKV